MAYVPRPFQVKKCKHCSTDFETNHKSRIYCSQSCNTLAWMDRHQVRPGNASNGKKKATLDFNVQNMATVATATLAADGVKELGKSIFGYKSAEERKIDALIEEVKQLKVKLEGGNHLQGTATLQNLPQKQQAVVWSATGEKVSLLLPEHGWRWFDEVSNGKAMRYVNRELQVVLEKREDGKYYPPTKRIG